MNSSNTTGVSAADLTSLAMSRTLISIGFATLLLNGFVIAILTAYKEMRSNANLIICSMAVTDLLAGLVTLVSGAGKWTDWFSIRDIFCTTFFTLDVWVAHASVAHVLLVNVERYAAIVYPSSYKTIVSPTRIKIALVFVWIITLGEAIGIMFSYTLDDQCLIQSYRLPGLTFGLLITSVAVPFLSIFAIYTHIVIVVVKKLRFMAENSNLDQAALARSQRKVFLTVSAILGAWIVCWLPLMCVLITISGAGTFGLYLDMGQFFTMFHFVEVMSYANSLLNPILYFLTSADFRNAALELFRCKARQTPNVSGTQM